MSKLLGSEYYDEDYFDNVDTKKSNYGRMSGGYVEKVYAPFKQQQAIDIVQQLGYTSQWRPDNVLVVGCAKGFLVSALQRLGIICEGIDISEFAIKESKHYTEKCHVGNICDMKEYKDKQFEVVICLETLEHIPQEHLSKAIDEVCRVARLYAVISTPEGEDDEKYDRSDVVNDDSTHFSVHTPDYWKIEFTKRGLIPDYFRSFVSPTMEKDFFMTCERM